VRKQVTADTLSHSVEFDCPFRVHADGTISREDGVYAPELFNVIKASDFVSDTWALENGFSGQASYSGPIMHDSEYLGGGMARYVLENPGVYVLVASYYDNECEECNHSAETHDEDGCGISHCDCKAFTVNESEPYTIEGWALAKLKEDCNA
jgi:hypothetical protein